MVLINFLYIKWEDFKSCQCEGKDGEISGDDSTDTQQQGCMDKVPKHCKSDKERITFLQSLLSQSEHEFHFVVSAGSLSTSHYEPLTC